MGNFFAKHVTMNIVQESCPGVLLQMDEVPYI